MELHDKIILGSTILSWLIIVTILIFLLVEYKTIKRYVGDVENVVSQYEDISPTIDEIIARKDFFDRAAHIIDLLNDNYDKLQKILQGQGNHQTSQVLDQNDRQTSKVPDQNDYQTPKVLDKVNQRASQVLDKVNQRASKVLDQGNYWTSHVFNQDNGSQPRSLESRPLNATVQQLMQNFNNKKLKR